MPLVGKARNEHPPLPRPLRPAFSPSTMKIGVTAKDGNLSSTIYIDMGGILLHFGGGKLKVDQVRYCRGNMFSLFIACSMKDSAIALWLVVSAWSG